MWLFLASDCLFFGALISSYVLLASSLTMVLALSAFQREDPARGRLWLVTTALLGLTFVGGQAYEFTTFYREGLSLSANLFGSNLFLPPPPPPPPPPKPH